jgi:hypothetical protein
MEKDSTEVSCGQVMSMFQRMMEKMEQDKQEMNKRMDQMNTSIENIKDEVGGVKKEIVQTSNRLYFVEEAIKRSSRRSSRSTSRATSPTAAAGVPTVTRISNAIEQQIATLIPELRSKRMFTPGTTSENEGLETLLRGMEIDNKMPLSTGDVRSNESSKIVREEFEVKSELQPVHGPLDSVSVSTPRNAIDGQVTMPPSWR